MNTAPQRKPHTAPHWAEKIVWRMAQDPNSSQPNDKVIVCEDFHDDKLFHKRHYHMVPVRASDISSKGCTLSQAIKVAIERKFMVVPDFLSSMVGLEIGVGSRFGIPLTKLVVVASGTVGDITGLTQVSSTYTAWGTNCTSTMGASGDEQFGPEAVFIFLARA
ncbi:MAG: hypothetical protein KBC50_02835 [Candidatus Pacebacteria bacterium]|nr:hypothetical protein [Candidatus Paceibacterota bacterium]